MQENPFPIMWPQRATELAELVSDTRRLGIHVLIVSLPWGLLEAHSKQLGLNHNQQSLAALANRGGLSHSEALAVIEDRRYYKMRTGEAHARLLEHLARYNRAKQAAA